MQLIQKLLISLKYVDFLLFPCYDLRDTDNGDQHHRDDAEPEDPLMPPREPRSRILEYPEKLSDAVDDAIKDP